MGEAILFDKDDKDKVATEGTSASTAFKTRKLIHNTPRMAAIIIFTVGFAPLMALILGLNINYMERKNDFIAGGELLQ